MPDRKASNKTQRERVICPCCQRSLSRRTVQYHMTRQLSGENHQLQQPISEDEDMETEMGDGVQPETGVTEGGMEGSGSAGRLNSAAGASSDEEREIEVDDVLGGFGLEAAREQVHRQASDDEGFDVAAGEGTPQGDRRDWGADDENESDSGSENGIDEDWHRIWEEEWLAEGQRLYEDGLSEEDTDNLALYGLRLEGHLSRNTFNKIRRAFTHRLGHLRTEYRLQRLVDDLSDLEVQIYECCIGSCCLFVGDFC